MSVEGGSRAEEVAEHSCGCRATRSSNYGRNFWRCECANSVNQEGATCLACFFSVPLIGEGHTWVQIQ